MIKIIYYFFTSPLKSDSTNSTKNTKNSIFAIPAEAPAIPPNPKIPAIIAMTINIIVQRNIIFCFKINYLRFDFQTLYSKYATFSQVSLTLTNPILTHSKAIIFNLTQKKTLALNKYAKIFFLLLTNQVKYKKGI